MDTPTPKPKLEQHVYAKFLIQKITFFGTVKRILTIHKTGLTIETFSKDPQQQENLLFTDISVIEAPSRSENEIIIAPKKTTSQSLFCYDRAKCICAIYYAWDKYILSVSPRLEKSFPTYDVFKTVVPNYNDLYIEVQLVIFRTHLELHHKAIKSSKELDEKLTQMDPIQSGVSTSTTIPLCEIKNIYKSHSSIIIELKGSLTRHHLLYYDLEKVNNIISKIQSNYKEYVEGLISVSFNEPKLETNQTFMDIKSTSSFFFECKLHRLLESGHLFPVKVAISDDYMLEIDQATNHIIQKYDLRNVQAVVQMVSGVPGVCISFEDNTLVNYIPEQKERDIIASNFFTLINWRKTTQDTYARQGDFIHCVVPNINYKVHCWVDQEIDTEYEAELIKEMAAASNEDDLYRVLHEFNINATLKNYSDSDSKALLILIKHFSKSVKLIKSKQFLKYWESLQNNLTDSSPTMRGTSELPSHRDRSKSIGYYETDEQFSIQLNIKPFLNMLFRTEELLKGIIILISSKTLFKEIANNKKEAVHYEEFIKDVIALIDAPYPTLNHLAGSFLRAFCRFPFPTEKKAETGNKKYLLASKVELLQFISQSLAAKVLVEKGKKSLYNNFEVTSIHSILASLRVLRTYLYDRKETTEPEDMQFIVKLISKAYYFAIMNFLFRSHSIACVYNTTIIINSIFQNHEFPELEKQLQHRFLNNSSLIPLNMILVFSSSLILQRKLSLILLSNMLAGYEDACEVLLRLFPKYLFTKVNAASTYITTWDLQKWEQFFSILVQDYDTPTEQWNEECRRELLHELREADSGVVSMFRHCPTSKLHEFFDPTFKNEGEFLLNIRWNFEEFGIHYAFLESKIHVWKYFLVSLLKDTEEPALVMQIQNPAKFWNELNIKFITTANLVECRKILKTLILLYQEYTDDIKELNTISFWLKSIKKKEFSDLRYLILQLLYTCLSIDNPKVVNLNLLKFIEVNGLAVLADVLAGLYFSEDHTDLTMDDYDMFKAASPSDMDYNYTDLHLPKQGYAPSFKKAMSIYFILHIYRLVVQKSALVTPPPVPGEQMLYPLPRAKQQVMSDKSIYCLVSILLLNDDDLTLELLDLILNLFMDKESLDVLVNKTPLLDFLLVNIDSRTVSARFNLILQIYHKIADRFPGEDNPIKTYTSFSFNPTHPEIEQEAMALFSPLRYFPKLFMWKLINAGVDDFTNTFFSSSYESPELIWNTQMREKLINSVKVQVADYKAEIINYAEGRKEHSREDIPNYAPEKTGVDYHNISEEVTCGPIMLRLWAKKGFRGFDLSKEDIPSFIKSLYSLLVEAAKTPLDEGSQCQMKDLLVILGAHAKAVKLYSLKVYECFPEVVKILDYFAEQIGQWDPRNLPDVDVLRQTSDYLLSLHKIIYRTVKLEKSENLKAFLDCKGFALLVSILRSLVRKISSDNSTEASNYYNNLKVAYSDLKTLNLSIRIIHLIHLKYPSHLDSLSSEAKLQFFLNLQVLSKISIVLFKHIKDKYGQNERNKKKSDNDSSLEEEIGEDDAENDYEPALTSIFDILKTERDSSLNNLFIKQLLGFTKNLSTFLVYLSIDVTMSPFFIQSGIAWRSLEWLTYYSDPNHYTKKIEDSNYQKTINFLEKICNALRNILIFTNEAYILKISSGSIKAVNVGLTTTKNKSPELIASLEKLEGFERTILSKFHAAIMSLIGKPLLQLLVTDYDEPILNPQDEDKDNILRFMKIFATSFHDPRTLWNEETKEELKELIITQIIHINESHGKAFFDEVEPFEYKCYSRQLIIDGVFISSYNRTPEWKITNPRQFIMRMLEAITQIWDWIKEHSSDENTTSHDLSSRLVKLNDAAAGISNIIANHGSEEVLLFEGNLTRLGSLLSDKSLKDINDPYIPRLKSMVLSIFVNLSKKLNGALKVAENVTIMRNMVVILRENSKEGFYLSKKAIKIVENISNFDNLRPALIRYGVSVILLELSLKSEIFARSLREKSFSLFMNIIQGKDALSLQLFKTAFPSFIQDLVQSQIPQQEVLEMLDKGCDEPKFMWTKFMRHETLLILTKVCETIQNNWIKQQAKEIKIIEHIAFWDEGTLQTYPILPELKNNIIVNDIFLKNFNRKPELGENDDLRTFVAGLVAEGQKVIGEYGHKVLSSQQADKKAEPDQKHSLRQIHIFATILTSLLLAMDLLITTKIERKNSAESRGSADEDKLDQVNNEEKVEERPFFDDNTISFIADCADLAMQDALDPHITSVMLELLCLAVDDTKGISFLKSKKIIHTIAKILKRATQSENNSPILVHIEEKLVLFLLLKMLYNDKTLISEVVEECLDSFKTILKGDKPYLRDLLESIVTIIAQDTTHGRGAFIQLNHEQELVSVTIVHDCVPSKTVNAFWKHLTQGWNPYSAKNTINSMLNKAKDYRLQCPVISDYAVQALPYADEQSMLLEVIAEEHIAKVVEEYSNSKECLSLE